MVGARLGQLTRLLRPPGFRVQCLAMLLYTSILIYWARLAASS